MIVVFVMVKKEGRRNPVLFFLKRNPMEEEQDMYQYIMDFHSSTYREFKKLRELEDSYIGKIVQNQTSSDKSFYKVIGIYRIGDTRHFHLEDVDNPSKQKNVKTERVFNEYSLET